VDRARQHLNHAVGQFDFGVIVRNGPYLWQGLQLSFLLASLSIVGGIFLGAILAVLRMSSIRPVAWAALGYVNFFRSVPLILVIFWLYFLVPLLLGRATGPFVSAVIAFTLFETAYYCEIIRAGVQSIPKGQISAGVATGMSRIQAMRYIVMPQAFRNMTPVLLTQSIILFQDTSLVYVVTLRDFMTSASTVANQELRLVELYLFAAVVYLAICFTGSRLVNRLGGGIRR
jgi:glutamate/aspartate transport system permease protein